jgi:hypothetical protein
MDRKEFRRVFPSIWKARGKARPIGKTALAGRKAGQVPSFGNLAFGERRPNSLFDGIDAREAFSYRALDTQ